MAFNKRSGRFMWGSRPVTKTREPVSFAMSAEEAAAHEARVAAVKTTIAAVEAAHAVPGNYCRSSWQGSHTTGCADIQRRLAVSK